MKECLDYAYNSTLPILIYLVHWNLFSVDNRNGNIQEFRSKQSFLSYCKRNLKNKEVMYITASTSEVRLIQSVIN
jgi:hypothetical protein